MRIHAGICIRALEKKRLSAQLPHPVQEGEEDPVRKEPGPDPGGGGDHSGRAETAAPGAVLQRAGHDCFRVGGQGKRVP